MKANCEICNKEIEVQMCCSGHECSCMGKPVEPPVCSDECFKEWVTGLKLRESVQASFDINDLGV